MVSQAGKEKWWTNKRDKKPDNWDEAAWKKVIDTMRSFSPKTGPKPRNMKIDDMMGSQTMNDAAQEESREVNIAALAPSFALAKRLTDMLAKENAELQALVAKHDAFTQAVNRGRMSMQVELRLDGREWPISIDGGVVDSIMSAEIRKLTAKIQEKHRQVQELAKQLAES